MNDHFITTLFCYARYHLPTNLETSHDLTPIYELSDSLPSAAALLGDKGYNDALVENLLQRAGACLLAIR